MADKIIHWYDTLLYGYREIRDAVDAVLPQRSRLKFGAGLSATDDPTNKQTLVEATGGGGVVDFEAVKDALNAANTSIPVNSQKITDLGTPTAGTDATTKGYVDSTASNAADDAIAALLPLPAADIAPAGTNGHVMTTTGGVAGWAAPAGGAPSFPDVNSALGAANAAIGINGENITDVGAIDLNVKTEASTGPHHDYAVGDHLVVECTSGGGTSTFTGFAAPPSGKSRNITLIAAAGQTLTFTHQSASSAAGNRLELLAFAGGAIVNVAMFTYSPTRSRWILRAYTI